MSHLLRFALLHSKAANRPGHLMIVGRGRRYEPAHTGMAKGYFVRYFLDKVWSSRAQDVYETIMQHESIQEYLKESDLALAQQSLII